MRNSTSPARFIRFFNSDSAMRAESKYCRIDHSEQVLPMLAKHHFARYEFLLD